MIQEMPFHSYKLGESHVTNTTIIEGLSMLLYVLIILLL